MAWPSHSLQNPKKLRRTQWDFPPGVCVGVGEEVGDGSTQINPNHSFEVQEWVLVVLFGAVEVGIGGGDVMVCDRVVVTSPHPQNRPGVSQFVEVGLVETGDVDVGSLHPNQPGVLQVVVDVDVDVLVGVGELTLVLVVVEVVSSLQPNHPGVLHVEVDVVVVLVLVVVPVVVVVSSRHPHQPGV